MATSTEVFPLSFSRSVEGHSTMNLNRLFLVINLLGGLTVLGSYAVGIAGHAGQNELLWGEIPESVRGIYTACMVPAALGYLASFFYLVRADWADLRFKNKSAVPTILIHHIIFLVTASAWMPLSWLALDHGMTVLFWPIQALLLITGMAAFGMARSYWKLVDPPKPFQAALACWGLTFLVFQCLVLDALVWPRFFVIG